MGDNRPAPTEAAAQAAPEPQPPAREAPALEAPAREAPDYRDLFLRATAELDNYRKRNERDRQALVQFAAEGLAKRLFDPADSLDRAIRDLEVVGTKAPEALKAPLATSVEGLRALRRQLMDALAAEGVESFRPDGGPFDPAFHEALVRLPHATAPEGTIVEVFQVGYSLRGRVLRPARVAVSAGAPPESAASTPPHNGAAHDFHVKKAPGRKSGAKEQTE